MDRRADLYGETSMSELVATLVKAAEKISSNVQDVPPEVPSWCTMLSVMHEIVCRYEENAMAVIEEPSFKKVLPHLVYLSKREMLSSPGSVAAALHGGDLEAQPTVPFRPESSTDEYPFARYANV